MKEIAIYTEYITLSQFLKLASLIQTGGEAKNYLANHKVLINDVEDSRRGRKLRKDDIIEISNQKYLIVNES